MKIAFCLNGENRTEEVAGGEMLIDLLRDRLHVRSVKRGCENAECGACTVLVNGLAVNACIYLAARIDGKTVTTLEGVGGPESRIRYSRPLLSTEQCSAVSAARG